MRDMTLTSILGRSERSDCAESDERKKYLNKPVSLIFIVLSGLLCFYLILPALTAVHLEGFTAQIESMAILMNRAPGVEHDPYLPLVSQFIYQTRSAVVDSLALIYKVFPHAGDLAFRGLVIASFMVLIASSVLFAIRWAPMSPVFPLLALVLAQGIPETAFFFNDNIISAAFASIALVLISKQSRAAAWMASGLLMGIAILSRVDAVFMIPMIIGAIFYSHNSNQKRGRACAVFFIAMGAILALSAIHHGFSLIDTFFVASKFIMPADEKRWLAVLIWVRVLFIGLASLPLLIVGLSVNGNRFKKERSYIGALTFIVYPVALAIFAPKATEVRYIFPLLAPMIALHVGTGLKWVYQQLSNYKREKVSRYGMIIAVFSFATAISPPTQLIMSDGPRLILGRLWSPVLWARWQASVDESSQRAQRLVETLDNQKSNVLISTHYNDEFYMRLRLIEAGFTPVATSQNYPGCNGFSMLKKGRSTVAHIRTDPQYKIAPISIRYNAALQISSALMCNAIKTSSKTFVSTFGNNQRGMPSEVYGSAALSFTGPLTIQFNDMRSLTTPNNPALVKDYGLFDYRELSAAEISLLSSNAESYLSSHPERDPKTGSIMTIEHYGRYYRGQNGPTSNKLREIRDYLNLN